MGRVDRSEQGQGRQGQGRLREGPRRIWQGRLWKRLIPVWQGQELLILAKSKFGHNRKFSLLSVCSVWNSLRSQARRRRLYHPAPSARGHANCLFSQEPPSGEADQML